MRLILLRQRSSAGSGNSTLISGDTTRRKGCRLGLCLLLASLALLGLAANLFLLYASIDAFLALLRRQCSKEEKWAMGERQGQEQASSPVPVPSGQPRLRISSDQLLKWPRAKNQKDGTEIAGENKPTTKMPLPLNQRITERPPKKQQPSSRTADQSSMRTTPTIAESPRNTSTRPRVRLMASDLLTRPQQAGRLPLGSSSTLASPPASLGLNSKNGRMPTVVTALFDIGRGRWTQYGRTMLQYHRFMKLLLQLRVPMVIMVDDKSVEFVHRERARIGWGGQTRVRQISLSELPLFGFQAQVKRIMGFELANWPEGWDPAMRTHPEASHPEYVLLVNSKPFFLAEAAAENPFGSEFFVWMDAGYGHGERSFFPANWEWTPNFVADKISLIKVTPPSDPAQKYGLSQLYRQDVSVFSGGFIAGNAKSIQRLHWLHRQKFIALLGRHKVDDDQTLLVLLANEEPELFHISHGDWFDAFELF